MAYVWGKSQEPNRINYLWADIRTWLLEYESEDATTTSRVLNVSESNDVTS
jgi:hypothetical protein